LPRLAGSCLVIKSVKSKLLPTAVVGLHQSQAVLRLYMGFNFGDSIESYILNK